VHKVLQETRVFLGLKVSKAMLDCPVSQAYRDQKVNPDLMALLDVLETREIEVSLDSLEHWEKAVSRALKVTPDILVCKDPPV